MDFNSFKNKVTSGGIGLYLNAVKKKYMCFNLERDYSTLNSDSLKLEDKLTHLSSSV